MSQDQAFRWIFVVVLVTAIALSGFFRHRARRATGTISRSREGAFAALRLLVALPLFLGALAYMVNPAWMAWCEIPLPSALRWAAAGLSLSVLPFLYWLLRALGSNISETVLTKEKHDLVTHGPYRWIRHPLYTAGTALFVSLGMVAANAAIIGLIVAAFLGIYFFVLPREEARLIEKFGDDYRAYRERTGRFLPRLGTKPR